MWKYQPQNSISQQTITNEANLLYLYNYDLDWFEYIVDDDDDDISELNNGSKSLINSTYDFETVSRKITTFNLYFT